MDGDGNVWTANSAPRFVGVTEAPNVTVYSKNGKLIKEIGKGVQGTRSEFLHHVYLYFSSALRTNSLVYESAGFRSFASLTAGSKPISTLSCASTPAGGNRPSFE